MSIERENDRGREANRQTDSNVRTKENRERKRG